MLANDGPTHVEDDDPTSASLTRRDLFQRLGWAIALTQLPSPVEGSSQGIDRQTPAASDDQHAVSPVMNRLSTYMSEAREKPLPAPVLEQAKWHVLDTLAAMVSGSELPPGRAATTFARAYGGKEVATVVADTALCGPLEAALANGVLAHADETDDSWPGGWHPGCGSCRQRSPPESSSASADRSSCEAWRSGTT